MADNSRRRTSSIPRDYHKKQRQDTFDVAAARALYLKLRALDAQLGCTPPAQHRQLDLAAIADSDTTTQTGAHTDAIDDLKFVVGHLRRPEQLPAVFVELYTDALQGRIYRNVWRCRDFEKGPDPTCSEVLSVLPDIDKLLGTSLCPHFDIANDDVKPFPFLQLPTELRLQVYSYVLPRPSYLELCHNPDALRNLVMGPIRQHRLEVKLVNVLRVCQKLHDEVSDYFYKNQTLFVRFFSSHTRSAINNRVALVGTRTLQFFKQLEIEVMFGSHPLSSLGKIQLDHLRKDLLLLLGVLSNVEVMVFSFSPYGHLMGIRQTRNDGMDVSTQEASTASDIMNSIVDCIPSSVELRFDFREWPRETWARN